MNTFLVDGIACRTRLFDLQVLKVVRVIDWWE